MKTYTWILNSWSILDTVTFWLLSLSASSIAQACLFFTLLPSCNWLSYSTLINIGVSEKKKIFSLFLIFNKHYLTTFYLFSIVLTVSKIPKNYDEKLEVIVRQVLYYIIFLHCIFGLWLYGTQDIFDAEYISFAGTPVSIGENLV